MPRLQLLLEESVLELVQTKLLDELLTKIFVEGVLPFYLAPTLEYEPDQFEGEVNKACFTISLVVNALKPALINCGPSVSELLFEMHLAVTGTRFGEGFNIEQAKQRFKSRFKPKLNN